MFQQPLSDLSALLQSAKRQKDKGLYVYSKGARTLLFRLEALCRLFRNTGTKGFFDHWYKEFKALEDTLGAMDYHDSMHRELLAYKGLKKAANHLFGLRFEEESAFLGDVLLSQGWLQADKLKSFQEQCAAELPKEEELRFYIIRELIKEWQKTLEKYEDGTLDLTQLEAGVHEFRRRIRWVSIYTAALEGRIELAKAPIAERWRVYMTPDVMQSPFLRWPKPAKGIEPIMIQPQHFYALSWLIARLAEWKDTGMRHHAFMDALHHANIKDAAVKKQFLLTCPIAPEDVCMQSEEAVEAFIYSYRVPQRWVMDLNRA
jgi:hypothetical protein